MKEVSSPFEMQMLQAIRNSADPEKALRIAIDILCRYLDGESPKSIMCSYGIEMEGIS